MGPLEEVALTFALVAGGSFGGATAHPFINDSCSDSAESSDDELEKVLNENFSFHYLVGSSGVGHRIDTSLWDPYESRNWMMLST